jgi:hypothetical protein
MRIVPSLEAVRTVSPSGEKSNYRFTPTALLEFGGRYLAYSLLDGIYLLRRERSGNHSIPAIEAQHYSITFRSMAAKS